jgi:hypothetical protein
MGKTFKDRRNWERKQERNEEIFERKFRGADGGRVNRRHYEEIIEDDDGLDLYEDYDLEFE